ncbi:MAG: hypothetical protein ACI4J0_05350, partial [Huintestinicola sp.]|uniref:hypothetical protein n=1 Tax=Huintestinicola sp. TaxID=2981661 RepID=UPI003EFBF306
PVQTYLQKLSEECSRTSYNRRSMPLCTKQRLSANDEAVFLPVTAFRIIYKYSIAHPISFVKGF